MAVTWEMRYTITVHVSSCTSPRRAQSARTVAGIRANEVIPRISAVIAGGSTLRLAQLAMGCRPDSRSLCRSYPGRMGKLPGESLRELLIDCEEDPHLGRCWSGFCGRDLADCGAPGTLSVGRAARVGGGPGLDRNRRVSPFKTWRH
jgi:hypothetical protein